MRKSISIILISLILFSCHTANKEEKSLDENEIQSVSDTKVIRRLSGSYFKMGPNLENHDNVGELDTISLKKIVYPKKTVFIYTNRYDTDTLTYHKDSLYDFSAENFYPLRAKTFIVNNKQINIIKCYYEPRFSRPISTGAVDLYNLYINDSLGIVLNREPKMMFREYDINNSEMHKAIIRDTSFFEFETPK